MANRDDQYRIIRMGGRPIMAIPVASRRVRQAAARRYQGTTWKRAAFQRAVRWTITFGVDRWLWPVVDSPLGTSAELDVARFDFVGWLDELRSVLDAPTAVASVVWPPQVDRGRVYVHLLAADGAPVAFAKIAFDAANNVYLAAEASALRELQAMSLCECHPPTLLAEGLHGEQRYVVVEPLPAQAQPVTASWDSFPAAAVAEYAGHARRLAAEEVRQLDWWQTFQHSRDGGDAFTSELENVAQDGLEVCRVHGDLGPANLVLNAADQRLWLFDWEHYHRHGPKLTDLINFFVAVEHGAIFSDPTEGLRRLASYFWSVDSSFARQDVMAALAYLHTANIQAATILIDRWDELPN